MAGLKSIEIKLDGVRDFALIGADDSVWVLVTVRWWDLATLLWWWFCPTDRRAIVKLSMTDGKTVRCRAVRIASRHARVRGLYK